MLENAKIRSIIIKGLKLNMCKSAPHWISSFMEEIGSANKKLKIIGWLTWNLLSLDCKKVLLEYILIDLPLIILIIVSSFLHLWNLDKNNHRWQCIANRIHIKTYRNWCIIVSLISDVIFCNVIVIYLIWNS